MLDYPGTLTVRRRWSPQATSVFLCANNTQSAESLLTEWWPVTLRQLMPCARTCEGKDRCWKSPVNSSVVTDDACKSCSWRRWRADRAWRPERQSGADSPPSAAMGAPGPGDPSPSPGWRWRSGIDSARRPRWQCACTRILSPSAPRWPSPTWQRWAAHDLRGSTSRMLDCRPVRRQ